jgi:hypothetical protein
VSALVRYMVCRTNPAPLVHDDVLDLITNHQLIDILARMIQHKERVVQKHACLTLVHLLQLEKERLDSFIGLLLLTRPRDSTCSPTEFVFQRASQASSPLAMQRLCTLLQQKSAS